MWTPRAFSSSGLSALTLAWVPTGMKAGVSTSQCTVRRRPRRPPSSSASSSKLNSAPARTDQHAVAEAVEPVLVGDSFPVRLQDPLSPGEGADQHQQRAPRKVKVGQERIHDLKAKPRDDEEFSPALARLQAISAARLQRPDGGRAHGGHSSAPGPRRGDRVDRLLREGKSLAVDAMSRRLIDADRLEG